MELVETKEATLCNAILNHPTVYPYVKGPAEGPMDVAPALSSEGTILYAVPDAVFMFTDKGFGLWEASIASLPVARGERVRTLFREAIDRIFERPDVEALVVPAPEAHARLLNVLRDTGFQEAGVAGEYPFREDDPASLLRPPQDWSALMPWMAAIPAVIGAVGSIVGNKQQGDAAARAARMAGPHGVSGDFGNSSVDGNGNMTFNLDPQSQQWADLAQKLGLGQLQQFKSNPLDALTDQQSSMADNWDSILHTSQDQYGSLAGNFFDALKNFDPQSAATDRYNLLSKQAAPGESQARNAYQQKLFAQGRLGTSGGALDMKALLDSQGNADVSRQLAGQDLGMSWQKQLAQMFGQFNTGYQNTGAARYGLANDLISQGRAADNYSMSSSAGMDSLYQQMFQPLLDFQKTSSGNETGARIGAAQAGATGDMFSGMLGQLTGGGMDSPVGQWGKQIFGGGGGGVGTTPSNLGLGT